MWFWIFEHHWQSLDIVEHLRKSHKTFVNLWTSLENFEHMSKSLKSTGNLCNYLKVFANIRRTMEIYEHILKVMKTYATYLFFFWNMLEFAETIRIYLKNLENMWTSQKVIESLETSGNIWKYFEISENLCGRWLDWPLPQPPTPIHAEQGRNTRWECNRKRKPAEARLPYINIK